MSVIQGAVHRYGDNINTDIITPGKYMELSIAEMAKHAMEGVDPGFSARVRPGDILVGLRNFGSGSSRETAPAALRAAGIAAIIARSFARIFYRNAFNIGLPAIELAQVEEIGDGDRLEIDLEAGTIADLTTGQSYRFSPIPAEILEMLRAGGLVAQLERQQKGGEA